MNRKYLLLIAALVLFIFAGILDIRLTHQPEEPIQHVPGHLSASDGQGLYENCLPALTEAECLDHLKRMASAGFKLVLNYGQMYASAGQEVTYAQHAHALGMKVIWAMNDVTFWDGANVRQHFSLLASTCSCSTNVDFIRYVVGLVENLPGTWGYYIGDELPPKYSKQLQQFSESIYQADPSHPRLFVGSAAYSVDVSGVLTPFVNTADVLGLDYYPIGRKDIPHALSATGEIAKALQNTVDRDKRQGAIVLQAHSLGEYEGYNYLCQPYPGCMPYPTIDEMRMMLQLVLQNSHPRLLLWYSYFDILRADNPALRWANLRAVANQDKATSMLMWLTDKEGIVEKSQSLLF